MTSNMKWIFLAGLLAALPSAAQEKPVPFGDNSAAGKYYEINGCKMYCEEYGAGRPVLTIHGNGGNIGAFAHNIPYFAAKYRVIATDSRAHGKSKDNGPTLTFEMMADDEAALLDKLQIDSAYVIGWSDGGIVALLLAMRHPEKVVKLAATGANVGQAFGTEIRSATRPTRIKSGARKRKRTTGNYSCWIGTSQISPSRPSARFGVRRLLSAAIMI